MGRNRPRVNLAEKNHQRVRKGKGESWREKGVKEGDEETSKSNTRR